MSLPRFRPKLPLRAALPAACCAGLLAMGLATSASAHFSWLETVSGEGAATRVQAVFGHHLTPERTLDAARVPRVLAHTAAGAKHALPRDQAGWLHEAPDSRVIGGEVRPRYWSRTTAGGRNGSRRDFPDAFSCRASDDAMKTVVTPAAGSAPDPQAVSVIVGHTLEIVPLADPASLAVGERLPLRVLFRGEPWQGPLRATWEHYPAANDDDYPVALETDAAGYAELPLSRSGRWLVHATTQGEYHDLEVCDRQAWNASLTFGLR